MNGKYTIHAKVDGLQVGGRQYMADEHIRTPGYRIRQFSTKERAIGWVQKNISASPPVWKERVYIRKN